MGRYNFTAAKVHSQATQLLALGRLPSAPAWYEAVGRNPSSEILTRRSLRKVKRKSGRASRLFQPLSIKHRVDEKLRWEFFNDHPWELARPTVVLEADGRDQEKWDWGHPLARPDLDVNDMAGSRRIQKEWDAKQAGQAARPINGESVIQRQKWLMRHRFLKEEAAYDIARKELYAARHSQEIASRVATEEATFYGGIHGKTAIEVGMMLEDKAYEEWRTWAAKEVSAAKVAKSQQYTGIDAEDGDETDPGRDDGRDDLDSEDTPTSKADQDITIGA